MLKRRLHATMVYVTHDQVEGMTLGDRVVVMDQGIVQQVGCPSVVYDRPRNRFVAGFLGWPAMNFLDGMLVPCNNGLDFQSPSGRLCLSASVAENCATAPFLADRRVVIVRDVGRFSSEEVAPLLKSGRVELLVVEVAGPYTDRILRWRKPSVGVICPAIGERAIDPYAHPYERDGGNQSRPGSLPQNDRKGVAEHNPEHRPNLLLGSLPKRYSGSRIVA